MSDQAQGAEAAAEDTAADVGVGLSSMLAADEAAAAANSDEEQTRKHMRGEAAADPADDARKAFLDTFTDPDVKGYVERKGFKTAEDVAKSFAHLERLASRDAAGRILLPADEKDAEGYDRVYAALGRPEKPEDYGLTQLAGADEAFASEAAKWLHEAGVSKERAALLADRWNSFVSQAATKASHEAQQQAQAEWAGLQAEWGNQFKDNAEMARRGAVKYGITAEDMQGLESLWGPSKAMKVMAAIGKSLAEDTFVDGGGETRFGMTPEQAQARMDTLRRDTAWQQRWTDPNGGGPEKEEWARLSRIVAQAQARAA